MHLFKFEANPSPICQSFAKRDVPKWKRGLTDSDVDWTCIIMDYAAVVVAGSSRPSILRALHMVRRDKFQEVLSSVPATLICNRS